MTAATLFSLANTTAMLGWLYLIAVARWTPKCFSIIRIALPLILSIAYLISLILFAPEVQGGFDSIESVRLLFDNDWALTAGWIHYLAFDFFVGCWIVERATQERIHPLIIAPILLATFLFGPIGYLCYTLYNKTRPSSLTVRDSARRSR